MQRSESPYLADIPRLSSDMSTFLVQDEENNSDSLVVSSSCNFNTGEVDDFNLFPDLPLLSILSNSSNQFDFLNNSTTPNDFTHLWDFNEVEPFLSLSIDDNVLNSIEIESSALPFYNDSMVTNEIQIPQQCSYLMEQHPQNISTLWNCFQQQQESYNKIPKETYLLSPLPSDIELLEPSISTLTMLSLESSNSTSTTTSISTSSSSNNNKYSYKERKQKHHEETNRAKFSCSTCNKLFNRQQDVNRHERIHTGVKDFHCDICFTPFPRKDTLLRHTKNFNLKCGGRRRPSNRKG